MHELQVVLQAGLHQHGKHKACASPMPAVIKSAKSLTHLRFLRLTVLVDVPAVDGFEGRLVGTSGYRRWDT